MRKSVFAIILSAISVTAIAQDTVVDFRNEKSWPALAQDRRVSISGDESKLVTVMKKRHNACLEELRNRFTYWLQGTGTLESVCGNLDRLTASHRDLGLSDADDLQLHKDRLAFAQTVQRHAALVLKRRNPTIDAVDVHFSRYYALHAEVQLLQMMKSNNKNGGQ